MAIVQTSNYSTHMGTLKVEDLSKSLRQQAWGGSQDIIEELSYGVVGTHLDEPLKKTIVDSLQSGDKLQLRHSAGMIRNIVNRLTDFMHEIEKVAE